MNQQHMNQQQLRKFLLNHLGDRITFRNDYLETTNIQQLVGQIILDNIPNKNLQSFEIPHEYLLLLSLFKGSIKQNLSDGSWWRKLYDLESLLESTTREYALAVEYTENDQQATAAPLLIPIGEWSDKHLYFLSCDRNFHLGNVFDCNDDSLCNLSEGDIYYKSIIDLRTKAF